MSIFREKKEGERYTITPNYARKTYTIRHYVGNELFSKYRTYKQERVTDVWTENDIKSYLRYNYGDYYRIK